MADTSAYIYGRNAILEALNSGANIAKIFIAFGTQGAVIDTIRAKAKREDVPCVLHDKSKFAILEKYECPPGAKTQGIIALRNIIRILTIDEIIAKSFSKTKMPVLVILDEINDPHNLGAISRSCECAGASGIIMPDRNSAPVTPTAIKISAGALAHLPVASCGNLSQAIEKLKEAGFWVIGTDSIAESNYDAKLYDRPVAIIIGSEGKGMRQLIRKNCDMLVKIPLHGKVSSLNASVSCGIILFEVMRQRGAL